MSDRSHDNKSKSIEKNYMERKSDSRDKRRGSGDWASEDLKRDDDKVRHSRQRQEKSQHYKIPHEKYHQDHGEQIKDKATAIRDSGYEQKWHHTSSQKHSREKWDTKHTLNSSDREFRTERTKDPPEILSLTKKRRESSSSKRDMSSSSSDSTESSSTSSSEDEKRKKRHKHKSKKTKKDKKTEHRGKDSGPVQLSKFMKEKDKHGEAGRSSVSGKKLKLKVKKSKKDKERDKNRAQILDFLNASM